MREAYKRELEAVGPDAAELARLTDRLKAGNRRRSGVLRPALIAAVLTVVLLGSVGAAAWQAGWLEPVVSYNGNEDLIEQYTVAVNETREGILCDVTLKNIVTDGTVVYALFSAEFNEEFDIDAALDGAYWCIDRPTWMRKWQRGPLGSNYDQLFRVDDRSQPGYAEFIGQVWVSGYYIDDCFVGPKSWDWIYTVESPLGREVVVELDLSAHAEYYVFEDVLLNDTIDSVELEWPYFYEGVDDDGGSYSVSGFDPRLTITPLSVTLEFSKAIAPESLYGDALQFDIPYTVGTYQEGVTIPWDAADWLKEFDVKLELADGTCLELSSLTKAFRVESYDYYFDELYLSFSCELYFSELVRPETVTALIIDGVRYEVD